MLVLAIVVPVAGVVLSMALGGRQSERIALVAMAAGFCIALAMAADIWLTRTVLVYRIGGWAPPLGIALRADGLSAIMALTTAVVICAIGLFARDNFSVPAGAHEQRAPMTFWTLLMGVWSGLNAVWLGGDLFTLYVALELLTFGAVPLVSLDGRAETLAAALRYLLFALLGSALYLLGVALFYGGYGTLDIELLAGLVRPEPVVWIAVALMTVGLIAKTALFPLHLWLPPAHAGAPAAGSALLSALVVKGSFVLIVRLWFDAVPGLLDQAAAQALGGTWRHGDRVRQRSCASTGTAEAAHRLFDDRADRLPVLSLPACRGAVGCRPGTVQLWNGIAWTGGVLQLVSHAVAKAAMFMAAGLIAEALGHDRIAGFAGIGRAMPMTVFAFALGGMSLMGLPPSGGFVAKAMLLMAAVAEGQWWWAVVILAGGLLAAGYVFRVLTPALTAADAPLVCAPTWRRGASAWCWRCRSVRCCWALYRCGLPCFSGRPPCPVFGPSR